MGPRDQQMIEVREDVLVYGSAILDRPIELTGPVKLKLFASSSIHDIGFTGKLVEVFPDGRAIIFTKGVLRNHYQKSMIEPELSKPGHTIKLQLDIWALSNVFLRGYRIWLEVSNNNVARFARNTNTGGDTPNEGPDQCITAINRVFTVRRIPLTSSYRSLKLVEERLLA